MAKAVPTSMPPVTVRMFTWTELARSTPSFPWAAVGLLLGLYVERWRCLRRLRVAGQLADADAERVFYYSAPWLMAIPLSWYVGQLAGVAAGAATAFWEVAPLVWLVVVALALAMWRRSLWYGVGYVSKNGEDWRRAGNVSSVCLAEAVIVLVGVRFAVELIAVVATCILKMNPSWVG
jgi:hypothetical protein